MRSLFEPQSALIDPDTLEQILKADVSAFSKDPQRIPLNVQQSLLKMFEAVHPGNGGAGRGRAPPADREI